MWICVECFQTFIEPKKYVDTHGLDTPPYEVYAGCPYCGGAFTEAHECSCCGYWIDGAYIRLNSGERICENCYIEMELGDEDR